MSSFWFLLNCLDKAKGKRFKGIHPRELGSLAKGTA
jgi:hypothetical protein